MTLCGWVRSLGRTGTTYPAPLSVEVYLHGVRIVTKTWTNATGNHWSRSFDGQRTIVGDGTPPAVDLGTTNAPPQPKP